MCRAYLVAALGRARPLLALVLGVPFFCLLSISFGQLGQLATPAVHCRRCGGIFLPTLSENLLATFLALLGGPLASIAYRGTLLAFEWLSPILPDLRWTVAAFLGTLVPALGPAALSINQFLAQPAGGGQRPRPQKRGRCGLDTGGRGRRRPAGS